MQELIENEIIKAKGYMLRRDSDGLVVLSIDNVARVEAMIQINSSYRNSGNADSGPEISKKGKVLYAGSSAYWITKLRCGGDYSECVKNTVDAVDRENSTHLNADGVGREQIKTRILGTYKSIDELKTALLDDSYGLIALIAKRTECEKRSRVNFSFGTKFCHYMCFYLFDDGNKDRYSIYDGVLGKAIPKYIDKYKIQDRGIVADNALIEYRTLSEAEQKKYYSSYISIIDDIRGAAQAETGELISRNGFDHLLWYCYKGE